MDKKLGENIILNTGYNLLSILIPFITAPYLGRVLGAEGVGEYTYVQSVASYFVMFGLLGISNYGTREIAKVRDDRERRSRFFWEIYFMQAATGTVAVICYLCFALMSHSGERPAFFVMGLYVLSCVFDSVWYCSGTEKFRNIVARNALVKLLSLICIFALVRTPDDLGAYFVIMALSYLLSACILWPSILKDTDFYLPGRAAVLRHLKPNFYLFIPAIAASIYQVMDKVMIGAIANKSQLAYYEYADKILNVPNVIFGSFGAVMLSRMSHLAASGDRSYRKLIGWSMDLSFVISLGFTFAILAISNEFVLIYYGKGFVETGTLLMILAPVAILSGWNNVLRMQYIIPQNLNAVYISSTVAGAVVNLVLNWFLIPRFGALGATIGTILAQCTITGFYTVCLRKKLPFFDYLKNNAMLLAAGAAMYFAIRFTQLLHTVSVAGLLLDVAVGGAVYLLLCLALCRLNRNHITSIFIQKAIRR